jgi:spore coat protein CotF
MEILAQIQNILEVGMSSAEKQKTLNVSEVGHLWDHLIGRYDVIETTNILNNFAQDKDLKLILSYGVSVLGNQAKTLEDLLAEYGIPLPMKPPESANSTLNIEIMTDRYIFREIFKGIQNILPAHTNAFLQSTSPKIRELFKDFMNEEMAMYDKFIEYGKLKGWTVVPPAYRA